MVQLRSSRKEIKRILARVNMQVNLAQQKANETQPSTQYMEVNILCTARICASGTRQQVMCGSTPATAKVIRTGNFFSDNFSNNKIPIVKNTTESRAKTHQPHGLSQSYAQQNTCPLHPESESAPNTITTGNNTSGNAPIAVTDKGVATALNQAADNHLEHKTNSKPVGSTLRALQRQHRSSSPTRSAGRS